MKELSTRERQVLNLVLEGKGPKEVADLLGVCNSTISTHINRIRTKMDIKLPGQVGVIIALCAYEREQLRTTLRSAKALLDRVPDTKSTSWLTECQDMSTCIERVL